MREYNITTKMNLRLANTDIEPVKSQVIFGVSGLTQVFSGKL